MGKVVAVLGGGVAGLSAAHELAERGFEVTVYERKPIVGGKARSLSKQGTGKDGRGDLPGEHGFRFFPGWYVHLPDVMKRIPFPNQTNGVFDNLIAASRVEMAQIGQGSVTLPSRFPRNIMDIASFVRGVLEFSRLRIPAHEMTYFGRRLLVIATSCDLRLLKEFDKVSWWDFIGAENRSRNYQLFLATGLTRSLVACRADKISSRTGGTTLLRLLLNMMAPGEDADRLLNGPTEEVWIRPWRDYLVSLGVGFRTHEDLVHVHCDKSQKRISGVTVKLNDKNRKVHADYYVMAVPVDVIRSPGILDPACLEVEPRLKDLRKLQTEWMNGIQFHLKRDVPEIPGHIIYLDSPWAITSISQQQFWRNPIAQDYGDGKVGGILSVDISDWEAPGIGTGKCARDCTHQEIANEVWYQLEQHLNTDPNDVVLERKNLAGWFLDPDIRAPHRDPKANTGRYRNLEPLLINTVGSWDWRPDATTEIKNLFLASDYVRTNADLATMEAANEAARRAVNGIIDAAGGHQPKCRIWTFDASHMFEPLRRADEARFNAGLPNIFDSVTSETLESLVGGSLDFAMQLGRPIMTAASALSGVFQALLSKGGLDL